MARIHKTAKMRDVRRTRGGCGPLGGARERMDDFRVFGIDPDKWTIAAQDEGE